MHSVGILYSVIFLGFFTLHLAGGLLRFLARLGVASESVLFVLSNYILYDLLPYSISLVHDQPYACNYISAISSLGLTPTTKSTTVLRDKSALFFEVKYLHMDRDRILHIFYILRTS